ncbi:hypothetical protein [Fulvimonas yonginensis]|uniref:DUF1207 domain-containing protein n=1 Tax=Fulvimonas yonginensis TaxID=1495200 RepID=A0ABU8JEC4_9GAMM
MHPPPSHPARRDRRRRVLGLLLLLVASLGCRPLPAADWQVTLAAQQGWAGGWIRVRENAVPATRLRLNDDLGVDHMQSLRLLAWTPLGAAGELHLGLVTHRLDGSARVDTPVYFNGTVVAPGRLDTVTHFQDFIELDAGYWHHLTDVGRGSLWGSLGARYVMLDFRMRGTIAADSPGHELKEDFYVQELPVPMLGLHLRYPLRDALQLAADASWGRLPWVDSLRTEGGQVRLAQTDSEEQVALAYRLNAHWQLAAYAFHTEFAQDERSREDGNAVYLHDSGVGVSAQYGF